MQIFWNLVLALQIISAIAMIGLVLVQHGKGADMGASFGSGASGSLFGSSGSANFLSRTTAVLAALFFVTSLSLSYIATNRPRADVGECFCFRAHRELLLMSFFISWAASSTARTILS